MALSQQLNLKIKQELNINQSMLLKLHLLQLPLLDINELIESELEENPFLEKIDEKEEIFNNENSDEKDFDWEDKYEDIVDDYTNYIENNKDLTDDISKSALDNNDDIEFSADERGSDADYSELIDYGEINNRNDDFLYSDVIQVKSSDYNKEEFLNNIPDNGKGIYENLSEQLHYLTLNERDVKIGEFILRNLDYKGYLTDTPENLAEFINVELEYFEKIRNIILHLVPAGCAAKSLQESLLIQAEELNDKLVYDIIKDGFEYLLNNQISILKKKYNSYSDKDVLEAIKKIKNLNPAPGMVYYNGPDQVIIPDLIVERIDGELYISTNNQYLPKLRINEDYLKDVNYNTAPNNNSVNDKKTVKFIKKKIEDANFLIKAIKERSSTLLLVGHQILKVQKKFFEEKDGGLIVPYTITQCAEDLGFAVSTISRTVQNKYIQTPKGIFALKFFFSNQVNDEEQSSRYIKDEIRRIIESENKRNPYSDEEIKMILRQKGIKIARKTVNKYRNDMGILSKRMRKIYE